MYGSPSYPLLLVGVGDDLIHSVEEVRQPEVRDYCALALCSWLLDFYVVLLVVFLCRCRGC